MFNLNLSSYKIFYLVWFISFSFWGQRAQVQRLQLLKWFFVHQKINYTCTQFNPCLPNCSAICGLWTTIECKVFNFACLFQISVGLYFCATVSLQFEHVLGQGTFGLRQYRLAPAFSCPPLTLSMNCLPAYSSMLSLIHTPICFIQWLTLNWNLIGFRPKKLTTQNIWWTIPMIFVTSGTFGLNELDDCWLCRSFVPAVRCSVSRTLCSFSPHSPFHLGCTIRLGRKDGLLPWPCWHLLYSWQTCLILYCRHPKKSLSCNRNRPSYTLYFNVVVCDMSGNDNFEGLSISKSPPLINI